MSKLNVQSQSIEYMFCQLSNCGKRHEKSIEFQFNVTVFSIELISKMSFAFNDVETTISLFQILFFNVVTLDALKTKIFMIGFEYSDHSFMTSSFISCVVHGKLFVLQIFSLRNGSNAVNVNLYFQRVIS